MSIPRPLFSAAVRTRTSSDVVQTKAMQKPLTIEGTIEGEFTIGSRIEVKPSAGPRLCGKTGTLIGAGYHPRSLRVRLDGSKFPITLHVSYVAIVKWMVLIDAAAAPRISDGDRSPDTRAKACAPAGPRRLDSRYAPHPTEGNWWGRRQPFERKVLTMRPTSRPGKALVAQDRHCRSRACERAARNVDRHLGMCSRPACSTGRYGTRRCCVEGSELPTKQPSIFARQPARHDRDLSPCCTSRLQATAERTWNLSCCRARTFVGTTELAARDERRENKSQHACGGQRPKGNCDLLLHDQRQSRG